MSNQAVKPRSWSGGPSLWSKYKTGKNLIRINTQSQVLVKHSTSLSRRRRLCDSHELILPLGNESEAFLGAIGIRMHEVGIPWSYNERTSPGEGTVAFEQRLYNWVSESNLIVVRVSQAKDASGRRIVVGDPGAVNQGSSHSTSGPIVNGRVTKEK
jgi:hypothetical protein